MSNRLSTERRARIVGCLVEGMNSRATVRVTGAAKNTITKLLVDLGEACVEYQDAALTNRRAPGSSATRSGRSVTPRPRTSQPSTKASSVTGMCGRGPRSAPTPSSFRPGSWVSANGVDAKAFMRDLAGRLVNRVQLTTDGHKPYLRAVESAFGADIDYAMLHKIYSAATGKGDERRYSPAVCTGIDICPVTGNPDVDLASTSYVERQNLTMRMGMPLHPAHQRVLQES